MPAQNDISKLAWMTCRQAKADENGSYVEEDRWRELLEEVEKERNERRGERNKKRKRRKRKREKKKNSKWKKREKKQNSYENIN